MANSVKIYGGKVSTVNGSKISSNLNVVVPQGMTGKQLAAFKAKNEVQICACIENSSLPVSIDSGNDEKDGDRLAPE